MRLAPSKKACERIGDGQTARVSLAPSNTGWTLIRDRESLRAHLAQWKNVSDAICDNETAHLSVALCKKLPESCLRPANRGRASRTTQKKNARRVLAREEKRARAHRTAAIHTEAFSRREARVCVYRTPLQCSYENSRVQNVRVCVAPHRNTRTCNLDRKDAGLHFKHLPKACMRIDDGRNAQVRFIVLPNIPDVCSLPKRRNGLCMLTTDIVMLSINEISSIFHLSLFVAAEALTPRRNAFFPSSTTSLSVRRLFACK